VKYALVRIADDAEQPGQTLAEGDARTVFEAAAKLCSEAELNAARLHYLPRELRSRVAGDRAAELDEYRKG
jgi:hypothetical protein